MTIQFRNIKKWLFFWGVVLAFYSCKSNIEQGETKIELDTMSEVQNLDTATFGAGCFWCRGGMSCFAAKDF